MLLQRRARIDHRKFGRGGVDDGSVQILSHI